VNQDPSAQALLDRVSFVDQAVEVDLAPDSGDADNAAALFGIRDLDHLARNA
jgi:hypothetical protein